jgi:hypothetical protein
VTGRERLLVCPECANRVTVLQPHTQAWCQRHGRGLAPEMTELFPADEPALDVGVSAECHGVGTRRRLTS